MKKVVIGIALVIFVPYLIVTLFVKTPEDDIIHFQFAKNQIVRVKREKTGQIENVPLEDYVCGVLSGEMPVSFELEALKAQAVAARSYVLKKIEQNQKQDYDVVDTVSNQVYLSDEELKEKWKDEYTEKINKLKTAVLETEGEYIAYNGQVAEAFFFSTSTGKTENCSEVFVQDLPYLRSVDSSWDQDVSPVFSTTTDLSLSDFYTKLNIPYQDDLAVEVTNATSTGRVKELKINDKVFKASDITSTFNLRSTFFSIEKVGSNVHFSVKGFGHGVGMSQYGALAMAKKGYKYSEILTYYYQGVQIQKI